MSKLKKLFQQKTKKYNSNSLGTIYQRERQRASSFQEGLSNINFKYLNSKQNIESKYRENLEDVLDRLDNQESYEYKELYKRFSRALNKKRSSSIVSEIELSREFQEAKAEIATKYRVVREDIRSTLSLTKEKHLQDIKSQRELEIAEYISAWDDSQDAKLTRQLNEK